VTAWLFGAELAAGGSLTWTAPDWVVVLAAVGALLAIGAAVPGQRSLVARLAELAAWMLALVGVVFALAGPVWVEEEGRQEPGRVAVLVDASRSMSVLEGGEPRHAVVPAILDRIRGELGEIDVYHFGDDLVVGEPGAYDLPGTDVEGALEALSERVAGERLAAVVLVGDGLDRGLLRQRWRTEGDPRMSELPGPLTVFQVGSPGEIQDLAVRSVDAGGYAFIRSPFRLRAEIEGAGFEGRTVPATLELDGALVTERQVQLDDSGHGVVEFEVTPADAGRFTYAVRLPLYEGDAVPSNNSMPVVVRVVRDRIRVLQVAGNPSWDVKFLRRFLIGDPSVQLVSFFILRTTGDLVTSYRDEELSLIQFPYRNLFDEDLWSFDVVVFQNFDYRPYFASEASILLGNLADYVEQGGAVVMVGGDRSFSLGDYGGTPLAEVLPVRLGLDPEEPDPSPFLPRLTDQGARHPVTRLVADGAENVQWWERLSPLDGTNRVLGARDGATVLLEHPTLTGADGAPLPVLTVQEVGEGRTMALTADTSWRWSLSEAAEGRGNQAYLRFWKNAVRWLMRDTTTARVSVDTPRENYAVGDDVRVVVRARDTGFAPLAGASVSAEILTPDATVELLGVTGADGEVVLQLPAELRGTHRVRVSVRTESALVGTAETVFAVTTRDPENDEVVPDLAFTKWMADRTGGAWIGPGERGAIQHDPSAGRTVWERRETLLWRAPVVAVWVLIFSGIAWVVRRRAGLR
jgi:uncharacterized membrane protein